MALLACCCLERLYYSCRKIYLKRTGQLPAGPTFSPIDEEDAATTQIEMTPAPPSAAEDLKDQHLPQAPPKEQSQASTPTNAHPNRYSGV